MRAQPGNVFDDPRYKSAPILIAGDNFGCGSSREHAVWGLQQYGIRAVIAPSFGEIFCSNAMNNGLLAVMLPQPKRFEKMPGSSYVAGRASVIVGRMRAAELP